MASEFYEYGGIRFRKSEVESYSRTEKNGKSEYSVKLKTGQTLIFGDQYDHTGQRHPQVDAYNIHGRPYFSGNDLVGVKVIGNPEKSDKICIRGNSLGNSVFTNNDNLWDEVFINTSNKTKINGKMVEASGHSLFLGKEDKEL